MLCESCGAPLPQGRLVCDHCGRQAPTPPAISPSGQRPTLAVPDKVQITDDGWTWTLTWRWFSYAYIFLAFFCVIWNGFLVMWYSVAFTVGPPFPINLLFVLFPLIHVGVGVVLTWTTLCGFVNRTVITVQQGELSVRHLPLPWPGNITLQTSEIEQFCVRKKVRRGSDSETITWDLDVIQTGGTKQTLMRGLDTEEMALSIEQALEKHLKIVDQPVRGEVPR